jgi:hypothetical protein
MAIPWDVTRAVSDLDNRKPLAIFVFDAFSRYEPCAAREYCGRTHSIGAPLRNPHRAQISRDQAEQHWAACHITPHSRDNINRHALRLDKIHNFGH